MAQSQREASCRLFEVAEQQHGFFTAKQAKAAGFAENTPHHVQVGSRCCVENQSEESCEASPDSDLTGRKS
jgi:hypothetical protein